MVFCEVINLLANPVEHVHVALLQRRAAQDTAQRAEKRFGIALMWPETNFGKRFGKMFQQALDFVDGGEVVPWFRDLAETGKIDFIRKEHYSLREIQ